MLTPQEVSSKTFPKAVMGGYAMSNVDDFLDALTEDYTNLYKDNAALKGKIKQLAEKLEESHKNEESFRTLLLSAQKMSEEMLAQAESKRDEIVREAESHRDAIMGDAEAAARKRIEELRAEVKSEEQRLAEVKAEVAAAIAAEEYRLEQTRRAVASFVLMAKGTCHEQLAMLEQLENAMPPAPEKVESAAAAAEAVEEIPAEEEEEAFDTFFPMDAAVFDAADDGAEAEAADDDEDEDDEGESRFFTAVVPALSSLKGMLKRRSRDDDDDYDDDDDEDEDEDEEEEAEESAAPADDGMDVQEDIASVMRQFAEEDQATLFTGAPEDATRVINLDDLQFGRNYSADQ